LVFKTTLSERAIFLPKTKKPVTGELLFTSSYRPEKGTLENNIRLATDFEFRKLSPDRQRLFWGNPL